MIGKLQIGFYLLYLLQIEASRKNSISALSRWKIFDNLRRSILPIVLTLLLVAGWTILTSPLFWTISVVFIILLPSIITSAWSALFKPKEVAISQHINNAIGSTSKSILQALFTLMCLPYEAFVNADAILRTLWRVYISRRKLLEWNPSGFCTKTKRNHMGYLSNHVDCSNVLHVNTGIFVLVAISDLFYCCTFHIAMDILACNHKRIGSAHIFLSNKIKGRTKRIFAHTRQKDLVVF